MLAGKINLTWDDISRQYHVTRSLGDCHQQ